MFPLWGGFWIAKAFLFSLGFITILIATSATRVQSNIKAQIGYSSLIQVGFMFCEIALGFEGLCLIHVISNAFLRGYQLLVSPSVVSYLIRYHNEIPQRQSRGLLKGFQFSNRRLLASWYLFSIREAFLEDFLERLLWIPSKRLGRLCSSFFTKGVLWFFLLIGFAITVSGVTPSLAKFVEFSTPFVASLAILLCLASLAERNSTLRAWSLLGLTQVFLVASVSVTDHFSARDLLIYLSGFGVFWPLGAWMLRELPVHDLKSFHGLYGFFKRRDFFFLLCCLGVSGFPISPSFLGEDLILHHATLGKMWLALLIAFCFIISGISALRIYTRLFLGPPSSASKRSV
jgi:hypothetical protein